MNNSGNACDREHQCKSTIEKTMEIGTPVRVEPVVDIGDIKIDCDKPKVCYCCCPKKKHGCEFIIKQTVYVEIPICYDVKANIGESYVDCKENTPPA